MTCSSDSLDHPNLERLPGPWRRLVAAVRRARDRRGLSQTQVAEVIKVSPDVLRRLETGKAEPGIVLIADLVRYLGLDPHAIIYGQRVSKAVQAPGGEGRGVREVREEPLG